MFLFVVLCLASIQVQITPTQGEISVGESKFFLCEVVGDAMDIDWYAPSGEKIVSSQDVFVSRTDESTSTLTIYHATVDSSGNYKCVAKSADKEAQATVQVKIFQKISFKNAPSLQEFNEGDNADIVCDVVSSPPATIFWKHKGAKIHVAKDVRFKIMENAHLQIRGIKKTDEGMYTCEARVMARGEIDFRAIKVVINVLPTIRIRQAEVNATADIGTSAMLACDADGFPEPTVTWARNNVVLETDEKYSLNEDGSELLIKDVTKVDEGDYTCMAKNKAGEKEEEVSLNVFVTPRITYLNNQTASELQEQVTLTCEASGEPTPAITWSFGPRVFTEREQASWTRPDTYESLDGNVVVRSDARVSSLTLKYVQFSDAGQYLCTARNPIGQDSKNMYLEVRYSPKIQGPVTVYTWEGNSANISCEVLAHPGASVVWFRDGQQLPSANTTNIKIYSTPTASYLEINPESQNDFGSYNCTATNVIGSESKEFLMIQAEVPSAPTVERVASFSSTAMVEFEEPDSNGGVSILRYKVDWRQPGQDWSSREFEVETGTNQIILTGLKPETAYEVKMAAVNGKGDGESSPSTAFKTKPIRYTFTTPPETSTPSIPPPTTLPLREPSAPKLEAKVQKKGNALKVNWVKQDDGGTPIKHYLVRYKPKHVSDWRPEIRVPHGSDHVLLQALDWNTEYEVYVVAENQQGKSKPAIVSFRTAMQPTAIPEVGGSGLGTGAIVGILMVVFLLLLVGVDVTCYFLNKCGLLMCIAVNFCGKTGPGAKGKDIEEGKAAFTKDESKEPIVEVRTEEANPPTQDGGAPTEPSETTPLTEAEPTSPDTTSPVVNSLPTAASNSTPGASERNTAAAVQSAKSTAEASLPASAGSKDSGPAPAGATSSSTPDVGPLVDLSEGASLTAATAASEPGAKAAEPKESTGSPSTASTAQADIKVAIDDKANANDAITKEANATETKEVKEVDAVPNSTTEVKTVPNEAPVANGNESKA
ncbi:neural cell adhesion molecule 1a isoform X1 [Gadus macrocephalus]|uniref:neural cell adhesion molecule 1a isoform X1 n=1 Tax=Gadus macrocephalus TaxID=80720 RepID=UPI0028CB4FC7|nr:neural cell adhesion molecule 1a isoform X1 [Gadus macrocephalus]